MITNTKSVPPSSNPIIRSLALFLMILWAAWVAWCYRLVDGKVLAFPTSSVVVVFSLCALIALLAGGLTGLLCRSPLRLSRVGCAIGALVVLLAVAWNEFGEAFLTQPDFVRIPAILLCGAAGSAESATPPLWLI